MNRIQQAAANWRKAGLENDFVFSKVMTDPEICLEVIQSILPGLAIKSIKPPRAQEEINPSNDAKGVRFDVYTTDDANNHYDIEMQVAESPNLFKRVRYYQSLNAFASYERGENYNYAHNSYVIFICCFDPMGLGRQYYSVNKRLNQDPAFLVWDGATDVYLNVTSERHEVPAKLQTFLDQIAGRSGGQEDAFGLKLRQKITEVKHNKKWRADFMRMSLMEMDHQYELDQAEIKGRNQGIENDRLSLINGLLKQGQSEDEIIHFLTTVLNLSDEQARAYYHKATTKD
ncbi:Rpn family recombination-promoting nuclease/putative transposase [Limosilactobacillus sp.]|jgi:predicted transposase/invertase (TIGR01784 family)|uniref:Rpn family recombination-promoting nuclease/putative transposase n=1 Tax=Limosilactobacillus sp. TaxID=2773925 RepID=UPI0025BD91A8|nr:Rpn family recombination-promoting nuclease/putative transposase [Limosilactobacillus sp.]MCH3922983.1 Rpn family recombination-promoting nuclease/putative transposase [Limosilactobacillus sp.]MCH3927666.1 Rpn family recombination-promoting nuclease/putative transposase [Limosilactobacillus sp.]